MRDLASPIGAFVREECDVQAGYEIEVDKLYGAFKVWAENNGHTKSSKQVFGRDLHAAVPSLRKPQQRGTEKRRRVYSGICRSPSARRSPTTSLPAGRSRLHGPRTMSCLRCDRVRRVHNTSREMSNAS